MYSPYPFNPNMSPWTPPFPYATPVNGRKEIKKNIKMWREFEKEFEERHHKKKHGHSLSDHDKDGHHKKKRLTVMEIMMLLTAFSPIIGLVYAASILMGIRWILSMASTVVK